MFDALSVVDMLPFGYATKKVSLPYKGGTYTGKIPEIVKTEAVIISDILTKFIELRSINQTFRYAIEKYPIAGKKGDSHMSFTKLRKIIRNHELYAGIKQMEYLKHLEQKHVREQSYPQIIDIELSNAVNATLNLRDKGQANKTIKPFGRLIYCTCGYNAFVTNSKQKFQPAFKCASTRYAAQARNERKSLPDNKKTYYGEIAIGKVINQVVERFLEITPENGLNPMIASDLLKSMNKAVKIRYLERKSRQEIEALDSKSREIRNTILSFDSNQVQSLIADFERDNIEITAQKESKLKGLIELSRIASNDIQTLRLLGISQEDLDTIVPFNAGTQGNNFYDTEAFNSVVMRIYINLQPKIQDFISLIQASDWDNANQLMASLGLCVVLPFSEHGPKAKLSSLKITFKPLLERVQTQK